MIYTHVDRLPVWNYYQVLKEKNLKYLIISDDYTSVDLTDIDVEKLNKTWEEINYQFPPDTIDLEMIRAKAEAWQAFLNYLLEPETEQEYHNAFAKYRKLYDEHNSNVMLNNHSFAGLYMEKVSTNLLDKIYPLCNKTFAKFVDMYEAMKELISFTDACFIRLYIMEQLKEPDQEFDLIDEKINIEMTLSVKIDVFKTSISEYMKYRAKAKKMIKRSKEREMKRGR